MERKYPKPYVEGYPKYAMTVDEAAEYFGIGRNQLRRILTERDPEYKAHFTVGNRLMIKRTGFESMVDKMTTN